MLDPIPIGTKQASDPLVAREEAFAIMPDARRKHMAIFGTTGAGKSTLLRNMAAWDTRSSTIPTARVRTHCRTAAFPAIGVRGARAGYLLNLLAGNFGLSRTFLMSNRSVSFPFSIQLSKCGINTPPSSLYFEIQSCVMLLPVG